MMISVDERLPQYVFRLNGQFDAKGMQRQSRIENTSTGISWTISGELALALRRLILSYIEDTEEKDAES